MHLHHAPANFRISLAAAVAALCLLAAPQPASAEYPDRPLKIVVPFGAGTPPDLIGRTIGMSISKQLNVPVVVENKPGANGNIGTELAVRAPADGYTMLVCGLTCAVADTFYRKLHFNVKRDLVPAGNIGAFPSVLVVGAQSPLKTVADLVEYARKRPKEVTYASAGIGGSPYLAAEQLRLAAGLELMHVPYSTTDPLLDVATGRITFMFIPGNAAAGRKDQVRSLAVASAERMKVLPDVPTMEESGYRGFIMDAWNGMWLPKGTPQPIVERINQAVRTALDEPEVQARLAGAGLKIIGGTPDQMAQYFDADVKRWAEVVKATGVHID